MSKQDSHFFNTFSAVIGMLAVVAIGIFFFSRTIARHTQDKQVLSEPGYINRVQGHIAPPSRIAVAGQDNAALAIKADGALQASAAAPAKPTNGAELIQQQCSACHAQGIAGAPKIGDKAAWAPRIAEGKAKLYEHAIKGFQGSHGVMPPQGGPTGAPDELVKQAVDKIVQMAQ